MDEYPIPETPSDSVSISVVWAVATTLDVDPCSLPPLNDAIDADALDTLFSSNGPPDVHDRARPRLTFDYADREVHVDGESIRIRHPSPAAAQASATAPRQREELRTDLS